MVHNSPSNSNATPAHNLNPGPTLHHGDPGSTGGTAPSARAQRYQRRVTIREHAHAAGVAPPLRHRGPSGSRQTTGMLVSPQTSSQACPSELSTLHHSLPALALVEAPSLSPGSPVAVHALAQDPQPPLAQHPLLDSLDEVLSVVSPLSDLSDGEPDDSHGMYTTNSPGSPASSFISVSSTVSGLLAPVAALVSGHDDAADAAFAFTTAMAEADNLSPTTMDVSGFPAQVCIRLISPSRSTSEISPPTKRPWWIWSTPCLPAWLTAWALCQQQPP